MRRRFMSQSDYLQPMYFEAIEDGLTISLPSYDIDYKIGIDGEWQTLSAGESTPSINSGTKIFFKKESKGNLGSFLTNVGFRLGGDCRSLLHGEKVTKDSPLYEYCFYSLFSNSLLAEVEDNILPATTLKNNCYNSMFYRCSRLTSAPKLPATTLESYCYNSMFQDCTSLVNAPELPATTLESGCYSSMFQGCSNLNYIKALFTTVPLFSYTSNWVSGVSPTGTFVKSKDATWDVVGVSGVPNGWLVVDDDVNLITFTLGGKTYVAEKGMTCSEWMGTEYNIDNQYGFLYQDGSAVKPSDILIEGYDYKQEEV